MKFTSVLKNKGVSQATLSVAVRARPVSKKERLAGARTITKTVDERCMVVMDPDDPRCGSNGSDRSSDAACVNDRKKTHVVAGGVRKRERQYVFDGAFDGEASNEAVYDGTAAPLVRGVLEGVNATVFAYGATGSGKTHTMVGTKTDPGLMILSLRDVFRGIQSEREKNDSAFEVTCSYTEVYNELVFDLLADSNRDANARAKTSSGTTSSTPLELREDPTRGPVVAGLTHVSVAHEGEIFKLLEEGNARRKTEETGANAASSRSHAVLEISVTRREKHRYDAAFATGKLSLVDLAGAERASETNNRGAQLRDGANINKSLLSLANCINALGKRKKKGFAFVPFRDSKLTRILKDGLCGNSRTVMVATVSGSSAQYEHTVNTLKYADRAKEIKTFVQANRGTVETHIVEYQRVIDQLREERRELKAEVERLKTNSDRDPVKDSESGSEPFGSPKRGFTGGVTGVSRRRTSQSSQSSDKSSRPSSGSSARTDDPIADVNELLLAAAAALPEGDERRAEAEALAARARRAAAAGLGKPSTEALRAELLGDSSPNAGGPERLGRGGDVFDGLQYATRVLNETVRLNRERTLSDANAFAFGDPEEEPKTICSEMPADAGRTSASRGETSVTSARRTRGKREADENDGKRGGQMTNDEKRDARGAVGPSAALSPVPEREAANRANVARVKADADSDVIGRPIAKKRSVPRGQAPDPKKSDPRESRSKKPVKKATKPSPYAQSASVAGAAGKPRSAALRRRLEKIRG